MELGLGLGLGLGSGLGLERLRSPWNFPARAAARVPERGVTSGVLRGAAGPRLAKRKR